MDTPTDPRLGIGMIVGPILVTIAAGLMGIGMAEAFTAPPNGDWAPGVGWMAAGFLVGIPASVWCLVALVVAFAHLGDPSGRWGLGGCINLASLAIVAVFITVTG